MGFPAPGKRSPNIGTSGPGGATPFQGQRASPMPKTPSSPTASMPPRRPLEPPPSKRPQRRTPGQFQKRLQGLGKSKRRPDGSSGRSDSGGAMGERLRLGTHSPEEGAVIGPVTIQGTGRRHSRGTPGPGEHRIGDLSIIDDDPETTRSIAALPGESRPWEPPPLATLPPPSATGLAQRERVQLAILAQRLVHRLQVGSQNGQRQVRLRLRGRRHEGLEVRLQQGDEGLVATVVDLFGRSDPSTANRLAEAIAEEGRSQGLSLRTETER